MPKPRIKKVMTPREVEKLIISHGWVLVPGEGSHRQYEHETLNGRVTIPFHAGDLSKFTVHRILKQAKIAK
ncbi:MAG: type II toxin-antitoxin system HicA family toxin [Holophagaceae bacterium]|nr:type II toxin-antitoxin system HicA family toxin [Holophagaceae bacterium]